MGLCTYISQVLGEATCKKEEIHLNWYCERHEFEIDLEVKEVIDKKNYYHYY